MTYKLERALQKIASLNPGTQGLEDARALAVAALAGTEHEVQRRERGGLRIVSAANRYNNRVVVCGARHFDMVMHSVLEAVPSWRKIREEQGFIDNRGVFHTREEALVIAKAADQLVGKHQPYSQLFSEDLY